MKKFSKLAVSTAVLIALSGCLEVEDNNNNDDVVAELQQQNAAAEANKTPIKLFGTVVDAGSGEAVTEAMITIKVGTTWRAPISAVGEFSIEDLPVNTDIVVLVQSSSNEFMDKVFYGRTTTVDSGQVAEQSIGELRVSEAVVKTYSVLDSETSEPFTGLVFQYNPATTFSGYPVVNGVSEYQVNSTFDENTGLYSITLPKDLDFRVTASGDLDGDGITDFTTEQSAFWGYDGVSLDASEALQLEVLYVNETEEYQPVELRITAIDNFGELIEGIEMTASDRFLGNFATSYDADTKEYIFNYQTSSHVDLIMPSFTTDEDVSYQSAQITLTWASADSLTINDYGFQNNLPSQIEVLDGVASVIVQPRISNPDSAHVSRVSSYINENDNYSLNQFYQSAIGLLDDSFSLTRRNVFSVIKGNASSTDLVPAGTTRLGFTSVDVPVTATLSHNDTFVTVTAGEVLDSGDYHYDIERLVNGQTGEEFNVNFYHNFQIELEPGTVGTFNIDDIKLDNNNGTTNGTIIVTENTAGETSSVTNNSRSAALYFPRSIESLEHFELNLLSYVDNGFSRTSDRNIPVVRQGNVIIGTIQLVSLAANEHIEDFSGYSTSYAHTQTSLADGEWYRTTTGSVYLSDNTASRTNTATYSYIYRVKGEDTVHEGTITLPVF